MYRLSYSSGFRVLIRAACFLAALLAASPALAQPKSPPPPAITGSAPTSGHCVEWTGPHSYADSGAACGAGGAVNVVSNSDGTLTISPTTGSVVASIALGHANTWTGAQTFSNGDLLLGGSSSGAMTLEAPAAASTYVITFPGTTDTVTVLGTAQTFTAAKTFNNATLKLAGSSSGAGTLEAPAAASTYVWTLPAATANLGYLIGSATNGDCVQFSGTAGGIADTGAPCGSGGGGLTVGTTTITSGTNGDIEYNNGGVLGELATTGSGNVVRATSPTLVTPALGTPSSGVATNLTGTAAGLTAGTASALAAGGFANPTATAGATANNGSATTAMRSDASPAIAKSATSTFGIVEPDAQTIVSNSGVLSVTAPTRTVTTSPTVAATDMGGQIVSNVSGGGTLTIPAISSTIFASGQSLTVINYSASTEAVTTTPTVNAGGGCVTATGIPSGDSWQILSNGVTLDCIQTVSSGGGGGSGITFTDGTHTVTGSTQLTVTGGTVGGTSPNATLTVSGGGSCPTGFTYLNGRCAWTQTNPVAGVGQSSTANCGASFTCWAWTGLTTNEFILRCSGIFPATSTNQLVVQYGEGSSPITWKTSTSGFYLINYVLYSSLGSSGTAVAGYITNEPGFNVFGGLATSGGPGFTLDMSLHALQNMANLKAVSMAVTMQNSGNNYGAWQNGWYAGDSGAVSAIRLIDATGSTGTTGSCTLIADGP